MTEPVRDPCLQCGPGYCIGDEGCRHRPSPVVSVTEPAETAEALRELSEAATPGPWEARGDDLGMPGDMVALTTWREVTADAAFIAAAVNYVRALLAAAPVPAVPAEPGAEMQHPRQRKGVNPFLTRSTEQVAEALDSWAADQRQRETWRDGDTNTYRYRANLLEAAAVRLRAAAPVPAVPAEPAPTCFAAQARTANNHPPTAECPGCAAPAPLAEAREAAALREISALLDQYDGPNMIPAKVVPEIRAVLAALSAPPAPTEDERVVAARVCQREGQRKVGQGLTIDAGHLFDAAHQLRMAAAPTEGDDRG